MQVHHRRFKEGLIRALFGPSLVPFVHVRVVEFFPVGFQLGPLNACMEDIQDVIKDFVE